MSQTIMSHQIVTKNLPPKKMSPIPTLFPYLPAALFLDPNWPVAKSLPDWSNLKTNTHA